MKVLIAEDDHLTREALAKILRGEGYQVVALPDGREVLEAFAREAPDLVCLDIMMPGRDGFSLCRAIRERNPRTPIIFISAKSEEIDKVLGLELGADDFIVKPFGVREVVARIRAVTRRFLAAGPAGRSSGGVAADGNSPLPTPSAPFAIGDLEVRPAELRALRGQTAIDLSLRDVRLLDLFARNPGKALTRQEIFDAIWNEDHQPLSRTLDQHIAQLRKRIEPNPREPRIIQTVHGIGYRYDPVRES